MQQIVYFIQKYKYFLLFILLELVAFLFTIQSKAYQKSQFINSANSFTGGLLNMSNSVFEFTSLKKENLRLSSENTALKNELEKFKSSRFLGNKKLTDSDQYYISAKIIQNNFHKRNNYLTIDKGILDGIHSDMGVVNSKGIIGVVNQISNKYATVLSILHNKSKINAKIKGSNYFGTLAWDGVDYQYSQLIDIQRQAPLKIGDTIISGGKSLLFPEGIPIGIVHDFKKTPKSFDNIKIKLFNDMSSLGYVQIIQNSDKNEIEKLIRQND
jgi:rod shape-determining protein MreC